MQLLSVRLHDDEFASLVALAHIEDRQPREQARHLLVEALRSHLVEAQFREVLDSQPVIRGALEGAAA